ncbi:MAG: DEAD/DEAH box helicase [Actinomycetes bacterium]
MASKRSNDPWAAAIARAERDEVVVDRSEQLPQRGRSAPIPDDLHPDLRSALEREGIESLWSHQVDAWESIVEGPVILATGTASGKSLAFNLPVLDTLLRDPKARALYIYPTKALAQDQARALQSLGLGKALRPAIYDGDTPSSERGAIRRKANLVLTNPDMLHVGILPRHDLWANFLRNLACVVIDEAHTYRGVFGSHVGNVLRRLRRLSADHGTAPRFLLASATIANPSELASTLTGLDDFAVVDADGAPSSGRDVVLWNPPLLDEDLGTRASALAEAAELMCDLVKAGTRTICFIRSRKAVELAHRMATDRLKAAGKHDLASRIAPYRAGYTPEQRRELERRLQEGELAGVFSTDALELGIDIGSLDAAICIGFPGTVASLKQMWGRAGRRGRGLAVYIAGDDALDQYFCRNPRALLDRPVEAAVLDPASDQIRGEHLLCAAHEAPIGPEDEEILPPDLKRRCDALVTAGLLRESQGRFVPARPEAYPAADVSLRSSSPDQILLADGRTGEMFGTLERGRAPSTIHPGAIYLHLGSAWEVMDLDLARGAAILEPFEGDWYTQAKRETDTWIENEIESRETHGLTLHYGDVLVTETVAGFQRRRLRDHEVIDFTPLDLEPIEFPTRALWFELPDTMLDHADSEDALLGALHAAEHAQIAVLPLIAMCDRWDLGGLSTNRHPQTGEPTIFVHEAHPGGVGLTRQGYERFGELVKDAFDLIATCRCSKGCPSCVQSPKCGNLNEPLAKDDARDLLAKMIAAAE